MQENLSEGRSVSWLAVPVNNLNKCFVSNVRDLEENYLSSLIISSLFEKYLFMFFNFFLL